MKQLLLFLLLICGGLNSSFSQTFDLNSTKFEVGDKKIAFELGRWKIRPESFAYLDSLAIFLISNNHLVIEVGNHVDSRFSDQLSTRLDKKRSESIVEYLVGKGVNAVQLNSKGYWKSEPIIKDEEINLLKTTNEIEEAHLTNRRTELKVIALKKHK